MAQTTFQGPVRSLAGFISQGPATVVNLADGTNTVTLDVASYAGKTIRTNDATLVITLPTINTTGGIAGSTITVTVLAANKYMVTGVLLASGTVVTPFADA
jgi:hypothetical protein